MGLERQVKSGEKNCDSFFPGWEVNLGSFDFHLFLNTLLLIYSGSPAFLPFALIWPIDINEIKKYVKTWSQRDRLKVVKK
jgi:hypothetical protein